MLQSSSRLLLYAILSSIEEDLRDLLSTNLSPSVDPQDVLGKDLFSRTLARYIAEVGTGLGDPVLVALLPFTDFGDLPPVINRCRDELPNGVSSYIRSVTPRLEALAGVRNRVAHSRPLNADDLPLTVDLAEKLAVAAIGPWQRLRETLHRLKTDSNFVLGIKMPLPADADAGTKHNLPTPDFDETGLIGREAETRLIVQACKGPYPVVSLLGEGGIGKTAVALKAAYEILDDPACPFDAIIWTTCKTALLTATEIKRIDGAIADSLGMFRSLAHELAGERIENPIEELLAYLQEFRILLVIDNLETVLDDRVRGFLERLPPGSKILITSRIGLGAYDRPIKLPPLSEADSINLLRTLALVRQVQFLTNMGNKRLAQYCSRLKHNPG